ncbi:MAG: hypothetical protein ACR2JY_00915 [Chloroflexota bacterium]
MAATTRTSERDHPSPQSDVRQKQTGARVHPTAGGQRAHLRAGAAKVDITKTDAGPVNDLLFVKALVVRNDATTAVIITVDAVAIGEIGWISNEYLGNVRSQLQALLDIDPASVLINASHCHGKVCADVEARTIQAVTEAWQSMVPVVIGTACGYEDRIMENRRLRLKNGKEADVRHAYSLPADEDVVGVGPVDPQIGILRLDKQDGRTLAVVYNFACHPIQGVPNGGNTADITGFASQLIEDTLGDGAVAFFLQGCAGDVNPILYKDVEYPRNAEPLGYMLGLSTMQTLKRIQTSPNTELKVRSERLALPRADLASRIETLQAEQTQLLHSLHGTSLNLKTFLALMVKYSLSEKFPSYYSHRYFHERQIGREDLKRHDAETRLAIDHYTRNVYTMEQMTRVQANLDLLRKHYAQNIAAGSSTIDVEVQGMRIGDFVLVTFPGELSVQIGLNIKQRSPHEFTFVAGCTNGYIYYAPTAEQLRNVGGAQEDSDCMLAPEWQTLYEHRVAALLEGL